MKSSDFLLLCRSVRFGDTDAAGVMHFHQLLRWCHEAYEESLEIFGVRHQIICIGRKYCNVYFGIGNGIGD
jgi:1,4-dihydroxy-2-naphthoyl-CoA hydrolase